MVGSRSCQHLGSCGQFDITAIGHPENPETKLTMVSTPQLHVAESSDVRLEFVSLGGVSFSSASL